MNEPTIEFTVRDPVVVAEELNDLLREIAETYPEQVKTLVAQAVAANLDAIAQDAVCAMAAWICAQDVMRPANIKERLGIV